MIAASSCSACSGTTNRARQLIRPLIATALLAFSSAAPAQQSPGTFELTPYGGMRFGGTFDAEDGDARAELDDDGSFGVIFNLRESANTQWELIYSQQSTAADVSEFELDESSLDLDIQSLQLGGTYMGEGTLARPYLAATIGGSRYSPDFSGLNSDTFWSFSIGGGLQVFPSERVGLRLEARAWGTLLSSSTRLFCSSGPEGGLCAISVDGSLLWQVETFAGIVLRF